MNKKEKTIIKVIVLFAVIVFILLYYCYEPKQKVKNEDDNGSFNNWVIKYDLC